MWFLDLRSIHKFLEGDNTSSSRHQNDQQHNMIEALSDHVECFIRCIPDHEQISTIAQSKYGWLHICWAEYYCVQGW